MVRFSLVPLLFVVGSRRSPPYKGVANWRTDLFATVRHRARRTGKLSIFKSIEGQFARPSPVRHLDRRTRPRNRIRLTSEPGIARSTSIQTEPSRSSGYSRSIRRWSTRRSLFMT